MTDSLRLEPPACKEWGAIVRALLEGEQILDIRKGGLREAGRHFDLPTSRFFLYPTVEHQVSELLKPAYRDWIDPAQFRHGTDIVIGGWADVVHHATITESAELDAIDGKLIWTPEYAQTRLNWKARDPLWVLVLRAYRLREPIVIPDREAYHGCTSWLTLADLPDDPFTLPSEPALTDTAFAGRLANLPDWLQP